MLIPGVIGIIADDLTGANDTALQFQRHGCKVEIILDYDNLPLKCPNTAAWAVSTESRNIDPELAAKKTRDVICHLKENLNIEYFYKKIDSTLRGNIAAEIYAALEATQKEAAIIAPAFVQEGRITIGGFQLLKGTPIERTEAARDPHAPIYDSSIPIILKKQIDKNLADDIALIDFTTVVKGAGPITTKINELVELGKKLIVVDALSTVDFEQIVLAMQKSSHMRGLRWLWFQAFAGFHLNIFPQFAQQCSG
ncbi:type III effector Hrp-dependent outer protein [Candidatus Gastranaerophilus sp. (ex Termes propinquus)]|nr:type III effector Hrp-dependent outer protein [Candidatus Gastranaerophilus sp. (ex Termes propinquus)]